MAYIILVEQDNTLYGSHKERIMQRSTGVDSLMFIVDPIYRNKHDMTNASVMLEYVLPVSREYKTEYLNLADERYKDCFLQYKLPIDTNLTKEAGTIELQLTFAYVDMGADGKCIQRVRKISPTTIDIIPISAWSDIVPDSALSALDQRILKQDAQIRALTDLANAFESNSVDNLVYDDVNSTLQLSANGIGVGDKVSVKDMLDEGSPVVDFNSASKPEDEPNTDNNDVESNVVEF